MIGQTDSAITDYSGNNYQVAALNQGLAQEKQRQLAAGMPEAQTGVYKGQAEEYRIKNASADIDLQSKVKAIAAQRDAMTEMAARAQQPQQPTVAAPTGTTQVAPQVGAPTDQSAAESARLGLPVGQNSAPTATPGTPAPQGTFTPQANAGSNAVPIAGDDHTSVKDVHDHLKDNGYLGNGTPNPLSESFVDLSVRKMAEAGVTPSDIATYQYNTTKNRQELAKTLADTNKATAEGFKTAEEGKATLNDNRNNTAYDLYTRLQNGKGDPAVLASVTQDAMQKLGLDIHDPADQARLLAMKDASSINMKEATTKADVETKYSNAMAATKNAESARIDALVNQGKLSQEKARDTLAGTTKAVQGAALVDAVTNIDKRVESLRQLAAAGTLTQNSGGLAYFTVKGMDDGAMKNLALALGGKIVNGQLALAENSMDTLAAQVKEATILQATALGATGQTDTKTKAEGASSTGGTLNAANVDQLKQQLDRISEWSPTAKNTGKQIMQEGNELRIKSSGGKVGPIDKITPTPDNGTSGTAATPQAGPKVVIGGPTKASPTFSLNDVKEYAKNNGVSVEQATTAIVKKGGIVQ